MVYKDPEYKRKYYERNKEKIKQQREENKEKKKAYNKAYRERNKEQIKEYNKEYKKEYYQTENGKKRNIIKNWEQRGLIHADYDILYDTYINTHKCDICGKEFKNTKDRCMDHDHDTGLFRHILCKSCNNHDSWVKKI